ncbi:hypothetical protein [Cryptosporangium sp. NPDC051539]|uniref:hypothetical protein n=1 Tax=Cryptosporangium sp. NPDC051539 TaxID=3363962 RepID=UPI0037B097B6
MAARHDPSTPGHGGGSARRRGGGSRHSVAKTDPLYWARARAAEDSPDEAVTEEFPPVETEPPAAMWSGRLPLPAWSPELREIEKGPLDSTTDSLPVLGGAPDPRGGDATTVDLPAVRDVTETVDHRDRPLALVPRSDNLPALRGERSTIARRGYTGRHRPPDPVASPVRLGLSTAGMTLAVGVLGVTLAMLHAQPDSTADRGVPPLSAVSPGTSLGPDGQPIDPPRPTPGPGRDVVERPATSPTPGGVPTRTPGVAQQPPPGAPDGNGDGTGDETDELDSGGVGNGGNPPRTSRPTRPTRPTRPGGHPTRTPAACTAVTNLLADDSAGVASATTAASTEADPTEDPDEPDETGSEEPEPEPTPSATDCP